MIPTVGRIVHYYAKDAFGDNGEGPYAAIVIKVFSPTCVNLTVFMAQAPVTITSVVQGDANSGSSRYWQWPPRE